MFSLLSMEYNKLNRDGSTVEWLYSFDIHCNSYFIYFVVSNVIILLLAPFLLRSNLFSLISGNSIYLIAVIGYFYVSFLGYDGHFLFYFCLSILLSALVNCVCCFCATSQHYQWLEMPSDYCIHCRLLRYCIYYLCCYTLMWRICC
ncbi:UNC-50 family protein [Reticulomyxa filosa]|uniref:UNC-50 family protein n=1 Tax=Reticulomyxa filosa TaxID=46433 RepID=X6NEW3_RETFI|nr:UNC-50 family protein [Reticulomyxa filosa]|eukprot:ETO24531.1 UNC-50 family protein [Reticulomyxa filosa]